MRAALDETRDTPQDTAHLVEFLFRDEQALRATIEHAGFEVGHDVGCGPGTVTLRLAPLFKIAIGLDPDPEMLDCASRAASSQGAANIAWVRRRAEDLPATLGSFRVLTFANSFHWMDRPRVASAVSTMLDPGGAVVQVDAHGYRAEELAAEARQCSGRPASCLPRWSSCPISGPSSERPTTS
jgi:ubiquinone/menaquinone biosynthesis C-methylase UbiE